MPDATPLPPFLYGTAWKEAETERLTLLALENGFRGIDTANQRKHYFEEGVGNGIRRAIETGLVVRDDLFLQTKFTFLGGQDQRLPYDPNAAVPQQVAESFASSLIHLQVERIDSYVLHGPSQRVGLGPSDWAAWRAMEKIHASGQVRFLGISNVGLDQLQQLWKEAKVRPQFVQNRCYANRGWDREIRQFCTANQIIYQGFSLLTANRDVLVHPFVTQLARKYDCGPAQIIFRFAREIGMLPLTGTTSKSHMQADLAIDRFQLTSEEVQQIERIS